MAIGVMPRACSALKGALAAAAAAGQQDEPPALLAADERLRIGIGHWQDHRVLRPPNTRLCLFNTACRLEWFNESEPSVHFASRRGERTMAQAFARAKELGAAASPADRAQAWEALAAAAASDAGGRGPCNRLADPGVEDAGVDVMRCAR